jgi:hypothetical protein
MEDGMVIFAGRSTETCMSRVPAQEKRKKMLIPIAINNDDLQ